jgi:hypothetical protein
MHVLPEFGSIVILLSIFVVTFIAANGGARLAGYKE